MINYFLSDMSIEALVEIAADALGELVDDEKEMLIPGDKEQRDVFDNASDLLGTMRADHDRVRAGKPSQLTDRHVDQLREYLGSF